MAFKRRRSSSQRGRGSKKSRKASNKQRFAQYLKGITANSKYQIVKWQQQYMVDGTINQQTTFSPDEFDMTVSGGKDTVQTGYTRKFFEAVNTAAGVTADENVPVVYKSCKVTHLITNVTNAAIKIRVTPYSYRDDRPDGQGIFDTLDDWFGDTDFFPGGNPNSAVAVAGTRIYSHSLMFDWRFPSDVQKLIKFKKSQEVVIGPGQFIELKNNINNFLYKYVSWQNTASPTYFKKGITKGYLVSMCGKFTGSSRAVDATDLLGWAGTTAPQVAVQTTIVAKVCAGTVAVHETTKQYFPTTYLGNLETTEGNLHVFGSNNVVSVAHDQALP